MNVKTVDPSEEKEKIWEPYPDPDEQKKDVPTMEDEVDSQGRIGNQQPLYDQLLNAEVQFHLEDKLTSGKVTSRVVGPGVSNSARIIETRSWTL